MRSHTPTPSPRLVAVCLSLLLGLQPVTTDLYLPALPLIERDLDAPMSRLQLTMSALILCFGIAQLAWGPVSDRWGRRPVLLLSLALFVAAGLGCAASPGIESLIVFRAAQGAMLAAVVMVGRAMVRDLYEPVEGAQVMSRGMTGLGLLAIASMPLGGWLADQWGWRANMLAVAGFGALVLVVVWLRLPETLRQRNPKALQLRPLLGAVAQMVSHPTFRAWTLLVSATYGGLFILLSTSAFVFIGSLGLSPWAYGLALGSSSLAYLVGTLLCRRSISRHGLAATVARGAVFTALGSAALGAVGLFVPPATPTAVTLPLLLCAQWLYALGHGFHQPCGQTGAVGPFPERAGTASALAGFVLSMTAFAIGLVLGAAFDGSLRFMALGVALAGAVTTTVAWTLVQRHGTPRPQ